ncbi:hypothetical protein BDV95DRAFT_600908 [Massariosphaeria phaeospora]|uniref:Actin-like ATPase domain-containing protein n=1 Tax=Massariosphaeria phaeospora TaxID=100035 RepID=A0A7C8IFB8_9PLEO|nr:hypothetical protein BDV95DRAFT_600908 [Massariosphaeria phaeospora]
MVFWCYFLTYRVPLTLAALQIRHVIDPAAGPLRGQHEHNTTTDSNTSVDPQHPIDTAYPVTDDDSDRMVLALDFGTTYSGVAYAFSSKPEEIHCIQDWPGTFKWGYELDRTSEEKIVGIKLLLDPDQKRPLFHTAGATPTKAAIAKLGRPPVDVASDYIGAIYKHALDTIAGKFPKGYLNDTRKSFVMTVPAVWSDKAKDTTLKVGDAITICDAGGGTVDLVSYEILNLHPLELKELCPSTGGIAGSLMTNKGFETWIRDMVGERAYFDLKDTDAYRRVMKDFDNSIKPSFRGEGDEDEPINFPMADLEDNPSRGIANNCMTLTVNDLLAMFQPVVEETGELVSRQVEKVQYKRVSSGHPQGASIKAIFLVGGFGESQFIRESIMANHEDIQVIQPNGAWSAIVRGAAMSKLPRQVAVLSSAAQRHYGVKSRSPWDKMTHQGQPKIWDSHLEMHHVTVMTWFIKKASSDDLERDSAIAS